MWRNPTTHWCVSHLFEYSWVQEEAALYRGQGPAASAPPGTSLDASAQAPPQTRGISFLGVGVSNLRLLRTALKNIVFVAVFSTAKVWKHCIHNVTWEILESRAVLQGFPPRRTSSRFPLSNVVAIRHKWRLSTWSVASMTEALI